jgi:hypothetical protein
MTSYMYFGQNYRATVATWLSLGFLAGLLTGLGFGAGSAPQCPPPEQSQVAFWPGENPAGGPLFLCPKTS